MRKKSDFSARLTVGTISSYHHSRLMTLPVHEDVGTNITANFLSHSKAVENRLSQDLTQQWHREGNQTFPVLAKIKDHVVTPIRSWDKAILCVPEYEFGSGCQNLNFLTAFFIPCTA